MTIFVLIKQTRIRQHPPLSHGKASILLLAPLCSACSSADEMGLGMCRGESGADGAEGLVVREGHLGEAESDSETAFGNTVARTATAELCTKILNLTWAT